MTQREPWKNRLRPFAHMYSEMAVNLRAALESLSDDELHQLVEDCTKPTETNCWWSMYQVTDLVAPEARSILLSREQKAVSHAA